MNWIRDRPIVKSRSSRLQTAFKLIVVSLAYCAHVLAESPKNIVLIVADDLGYSDLGCFGSEILTPNIDRLASQSLVLTNFHTAATCSPSRAMLLTGVDHHLAGMGNMYEFRTPEQTGKDGYEGYLNDRVVTLAQLLCEQGYHTSITGKWHLGYGDENIPTAKGFQRSWVLLNGFADHYQPRADRFFKADGKDEEYPKGKYAAGVYTDKAIEFVRDARRKALPFFLYVAYTSPHWPLQAPPNKIEKYRGKYGRGYDWLRKQRIAALEQKGIISPGIRLAPTTKLRPYLHPTVPVRPYHLNWDEQSARSQAIEANKMEIYAAMVDELDEQIGRLVEELKEQKQYDDSLIIFMSDNGAAPSEATGGGYGPDWARACTGPFRLMKGYPTEGGTRCPCIVKLPRKTEHRLSHEFASILDIAPTIYEFVGVQYPKQYQGKEIAPLQGESMLPYAIGKEKTLHDPNYGMGWELFGRAAYRKGFWKIVSAEQPFGVGGFELFDLRRDQGEMEDLAASNPFVLKAMLQEWKNYARNMNVVLSRPVDDDKNNANGF